MNNNQTVRQLRVIEDVDHRRKYAAGVEFWQETASFRVWAPDHKRVHLVLSNRELELGTFEMRQQEDGYFRVDVCGVSAGDHYAFKLENFSQNFPDPASRYQPYGPHGKSQILSAEYLWKDAKWKGPKKIVAVYELHIGTFTIDGTFSAARLHLNHLKNLGINVIELMPLGEFSGNFGWGYDGVDWFAPYHAYGTPEELKQFIDEAHQLEMAVILDVVYNHFGADGNYAPSFTKDYFAANHNNEWGDALNFYGKNCNGVRDLVLDNVRYWVDEFHFDGLRLDATQQIFDESQKNIMSEIVEHVAQAAGDRTTIVVAENEPQDVKLLEKSEHGGYGIGYLWNDDFHHAVRVALTGKTEGYYADYQGSAQELVSVVKKGFLYQGQWSKFQNRNRGTSTNGLDLRGLIVYIEDHDQVANSGRGGRLHELTNPGQYKAMTALLILGTGTPMLFQGQEFGSSAPFSYFADHEPQLAELVEKGRKESMHKFRSINNTLMLDQLPTPHDQHWFHKCKLKHHDDLSDNNLFKLTSALLKMRGSEPMFEDNFDVDGAVLSSHTFLLRYRCTKQEWLLLFNLGNDLQLHTCSEPLLAAPHGCRWNIKLSTEEPRFGGQGVPHDIDKEGLYIPAQCALVFEAKNTSV